MATSVLQELLRDIQLNPEFQGDEALQRLAQSIQTDLYAMSQKPLPPAPASQDLTPFEQDTWAQFQTFHQLLCDYSGYVNRDQWLHLVDVSADLLTRGPQGDTPVIGPNGNWWIGGVDTGSPAEASAPYIGPNGNWWSAGVDTGVSASGQPGPPGQPGPGLLIFGVFDTEQELINAYPEGPSTPGGSFLVGTTEPYDLYVWDTTTVQWVNVGPLTAGINDAPTTTAQPYVRNGLLQQWTLLTFNGGTFP